jgi:hypothetical protein
MLRPALLLELLVHLVPMVVGVWMPTWPTPSA